MNLCNIDRRFGAALCSVFIVALCGSLASYAAPAPQKKKTYHAPPPRTLADKVERLASPLLSTPLDESDPITSQIQPLVLDDLQHWLTTQAAATTTNNFPYDVQVRQHMEKAFAQLEYPLTATCIVIAQPWSGAMMTVASYTLSWSDYDRVNVIALFENRNGTVRLAGVDHFFPRDDLHYASVPSPDSSDFRFFVYGTRLGKSQPRLSAALYGYDGKTLKPLWQGKDFYDGKLEIENNSVVIRYLREDEYVREQAYKRKPPRHLAIYKPSAQGLTLVSDTEIPF